MGKLLEPSQNIERSIMKKYRKELWNPFIKAVKNYELVQENDKIAVCISGGKDSMLMAKLMQLLQRYGDVPFELTFLVMDPGYNEKNRKKIEENAKILNVPITVFETNIFDVANSVDKSPCYLCARMRRGYLYSKAKELGCNKIALGHHYDDVIETILMGMLYGAQVQTMMPKLHSTNFPGMELIRPMYLIREDDIKAWRDYNDLNFIQCACRFTENCAACGDEGVNPSKRQEVKMLIRQMKQTNPFVEGNIFKSVENVNLSTVIAYKDADGKHHPGYQDMIEELTTKFPLTEERITGEQRQKEFIVLFGAILRMRNLLTSFDEFAGSEILSERDFQDYLGRYQDLRDEWKNRKPGGEKEDITDDIVFEIELIKQIEINIDYILMLVQKYHDSHCDDKEILITIQKAVDASPELRSKKALIETFIAGINDVSDVMLEWRTFVAEEKERQLVTIIQEENLKDEETRRFMDSAFRDGSVKTTGTDIDKLMPPISRFSGGNRAEKKQTIIEKLKGFFDRFFGIG